MKASQRKPTARAAIGERAKLDTATPYHLFNTVRGPIIIAWQNDEVAGLRLAGAVGEISASAMIESLANEVGRLAAERPPRWVSDLARRIAAHLGGQADHFRDIKLSYEGRSPFHARVYEVLRRIPSGTTIAYGELANYAGVPGAARAVGSAMKTNRFPLLIPCHRVVAAGGKPGGYSAPGGESTKEKLLLAEGVHLYRTRQATARLPMLFDASRAAAYLSKRDPDLARVIALTRPFETRNFVSIYETLLESIVYQQLSGKAAATIYRRLTELFERVPTPDDLLSAAVTHLRSAGLSQNKALAVKDLALKASEGHIPNLRQVALMTDGELVETLSEIRGIGEWTVQMLLIFRLARPDVLPLADLGVLRGLECITGKRQTPKTLAKRGEAWRPFRTVASWYLWRATELDW